MDICCVFMECPLQISASTGIRNSAMKAFPFHVETFQTDIKQLLLYNLFTMIQAEKADFQYHKKNWMFHPNTFGYNLLIN
jgi:hypothetical protein